MKNYLFILMLTALFALAGCNNNGDGYRDDGKIDILVCMHGDGNNFHIVGMLPDGSQKRYLFRGSESFEDPKQASIGSDGVTLLMASDNNDGVHTYNLLTKTLTALTDPGDYEVPTFSPDMKKVYVTNDSDIITFIEIDVATKTVTVLDDQNKLIYPSFMNDGETMIVNLWNNSIASIKKDGTGLTMLKENDEYAWYQHPLFVPALNKVVYVKTSYDEELESDYARICLMNVDGSGEVELTPGEVNYYSPSISSDRNTISFMGENKVVYTAAFNVTSIATLQAISESEDNIWRPQFNRIDKTVFESLPDFERPVWE